MNQKWNLQDIRPVSRDKEPARRIDAAERSASSRNESTRGEGNIRITRSDTVSQSHPPVERRQPMERTHPMGMSSRLAEQTVSDDEVGTVPIINKKKNTTKHLILAGLLFVLIAGTGIAVAYATGGATLTVYPKERTLNVNAEFTAFKEKRPGELSYEVLIIEATKEKQVTASGQETVTVQATGEIEISKATAGPERLIKNTRFATPDGLIFRIEESVVVPGAVRNGAGDLVPGTIRAKVFAEAPGDRYNIKPNTVLRVPGFQEGGFTDLYNAITAKSVSGFTDGFSGPRFIIDEAELATARQELQTELRDELLAQIDGKRPPQFVTFPGAVAITYNQLPTIQYEGETVTLREQGVLQIPMFIADDFAAFIAQETIVGYEGEPVRINNLNDLRFAYTATSTSQSVLADLTEITFDITGEPQIVWRFDEGRLKLDIAGKEKTAVPQIIAAYRGIDRSELIIRPVWERTIPENIEDITINEVLPEVN